MQQLLLLDLQALRGDLLLDFPFILKHKRPGVIAPIFKSVCVTVSPRVGALVERLASDGRLAWA